mmetsp:Transcript_81903/g.187437  ORF Transcript_81903/g.187437 Transcript_81903/m.187437 type:complete len:106 (-) Transcript_81903:351-668(-)
MGQALAPAEPPAPRAWWQGPAGADEVYGGLAAAPAMQEAQSWAPEATWGPPGAAGKKRVLGVRRRAPEQTPPAAPLARHMLGPTPEKQERPHEEDPAKRMKVERG